MKKMLSILLMLVFVSPVNALAAQQRSGQSEAVETETVTETCESCSASQVQSKSGQQNSTSNQTSTQNSGEQIKLQIHVEEAEKSQLQQEIQLRQQQLEQEQLQIKEQLKEIKQDQSQARLAIHTFDVLTDLLGEEGEEYKTLIEEITSLQAKNEAVEDKLQARSSWIEFLIGANQDEVTALEEQAAQIKTQAQTLELLTLALDDETQVILQEQLNNLIREQERLEQYSAEKEQRQGIFGWFFNLFN